MDESGQPGKDPGRMETGCPLEAAAILVADRPRPLLVVGSESAVVGPVSGRASN